MQWSLFDWWRACLPGSVINFNNNFVSPLHCKSWSRGREHGYTAVIHLNKNWCFSIKSVLCGVLWFQCPGVQFLSTQLHHFNINSILKVRQLWCWIFTILLCLFNLKDSTWCVHLSTTCGQNENMKMLLSVVRGSVYFAPPCKIVNPVCSVIAQLLISCVCAILDKKPSVCVLCLFTLLMQRTALLGSILPENGAWDNIVW